MKVLTVKDFEVNKSKQFALGFLKSYDIFGAMNKYRDYNGLPSIETYSYKQSFLSIGDSLKKYIEQEKKI